MSEAILVLLWLICFVVFAILLPWWTYTDAKSKGYSAAPLWAIIVFLTPLIGIVLYMLFGETVR